MNTVRNTYATKILFAIEIIRCTLITYSDFTPLIEHRLYQDQSNLAVLKYWANINLHIKSKAPFRGCCFAADIINTSGFINPFFRITTVNFYLFITLNSAYCILFYLVFRLVFCLLYMLLNAGHFDEHLLISKNDNLFEIVSSIIFGLQLNF